VIRSGATYSDVKSPREWCVLGNLPLPETEICQDARLAMIHTSKSILDSNLQQLMPSSVSFVNGLQSSFKMIPFDGGKE
jgi:hypothetical protein